jgi:hypothetical protein
MFESNIFGLFPTFFFKSISIIWSVFKVYLIEFQIGSNI